MKKQELLEIINSLPDNKEINLVVASENDNDTPVSLTVNNLDGYPAELVMVLEESSCVAYENRADEVIDTKIKPEEFSFSEVMEAIAKELSEKSGEELAEIAKNILDIKCEYEGDSIFLVK